MMKSKNRFSFSLREIIEIQKVAEILLVVGRLREDNKRETRGICAGLNDRLKTVGIDPYNFMAAFLDNEPAYGGLEPSGYFGEIRQGVLMLIVELTPEELQDVVHAPMVSGLGESSH
jgi:hypothetical protein